MVRFDSGFLEHRFCPWEQLPDLELYMDQVISYLERQLRPVSRDSKLITSSMINNYVKEGILPRPNHKRYGREHLALLTMACVLKQVVPLPVVRMLFIEIGGGEQLPGVYDRFCETVERSLRESCGRAGEREMGWADIMSDLAFEAAARRLCVGEIAAQMEREGEAAK